MGPRHQQNFGNLRMTIPRHRECYNAGIMRIPMTESLGS